VQVIIVIGHHRGRRQGVRERDTMPLVASTPEGSKPQGEEQVRQEHVVRQEHIVVGDVVGLMRSF
jgi:hypothetical protein